MQKNDEKEPTTIPHQVHLFTASQISEALGKRVISISDISAKVSSDGLYADISVRCVNRNIAPY